MSGDAESLSMGGGGEAVEVMLPLLEITTAPLVTSQAMISSAMGRRNALDNGAESCKAADHTRSCAWSELRAGSLWDGVRCCWRE